MKAAVCNAFNQPLVIEDVKIDSPGPGEVKVRYAASSICHSDINLISGQFSQDLPVIAGHESAGYIEEIGKGVTMVKPGDSVLVSSVISCGHCKPCLKGLPHLCELRMTLDIKGHLRNQKGQPIFTNSMIAGFAEQSIVVESLLTKLPSDFPPDRAALLACGVITGFGAVVNRAKVQPLSSVVVIGTGGVGLNAIQGAAYVGAYPIIAVDIFDNKLEAARAFGATHTINSKKEDTVEAVKQLTAGLGADYIFVTVGSTPAVVQGFSMSGPRGTTIIIGVPSMKERILSLPVHAFIKDERVVMGGYMGSTNLSVDIPRLVNLYQRGRLKLDELITGRYPLEKINEAMESVERGEALRNVIIF